MYGKGNNIMLLTIITVCYNDCANLVKTLKSIEQNFELSDGQIEIVIIDGNSTDQTEKYAFDFKDNLLRQDLKVHFFSEPDKGIYDAMNKGIQKANGSWCLYLNAGDIFCDKIVADDKWFNDQYDIVYGDVVYSYNGRYTYVRSRSEEELSFLNGMEFCHQSCFIKTDYLKRSQYSLTYRIAGDFNYFVEAYCKGANFHYIGVPISVFEMTGISSTNAGIVNDENSEVLYRHGLIKRSKYIVCKTKAKIQILIRRIVPNKIISIRHDSIMDKATTNWATSIRECIKKNRGRCN